MKNTYISIAVLVLAGIAVFFVMGRNNVQAPASNNGGSMPKMQGATVPPDYNAAVSATLGPVKEFTVTGQNFSFTPNVINVNKGDVVKITFKNAQGFHDFRLDDFKVATTQMQTGGEGTVTFVADKTGSFQYYCSVGQHRANGMWGTLTVK